MLTGSKIEKCRVLRLDLSSGLNFSQCPFEGVNNSLCLAIILRVKWSGFQMYDSVWLKKCLKSIACQLRAIVCYQDLRISKSAKDVVKLRNGL